MSQTKAEIKRESFKGDHPMQGQSELSLRLAGRNLAPWGFEHQGTVAVHFYQKPGTRDFIFISQLTGMQVIPEGQADLGLKELRRSMMDAYGREDSKRREL